MPVGAGISSSFGIATETTVGTPVAVTRFYEFDTESVQVKKHTVQGTGLRQGGLVARAARRRVVAREVQGDVNLSVTSTGFGLLLQHMLGSTPTISGPTNGLYRQVHSVGTLNGRTFTTQIVRPDTTGDLTQAAYTYPGCKITDWEISVQQQQQVKLKITIDALDEATPSNTFTGTTLSAGTAANATTITTVAVVPVGAYVAVDYGSNAEVVRVTASTGSGPYTLTLATALTIAHTSGAAVQSATGINYGAATAFQLASYNAASTEFNFIDGALVAGGTTTATGGVWSNLNGQVVANVRSVTLTGKNSVKADRWGLGQVVRSEQLENGWREYTATVDVEYNGRAFYDAYVGGVPIDLQLTFTTRAGAVLQFILPANFQDDGGNPNVGGPDIITQALKFTILDDGTNGALQAIYTSTDAAA